MAQYKKKEGSQIIGIQFSILSPEEIRKGSVAEITNRDTYVNNKPVINGLFDPRMGVIEPGYICPSDGLDYMQTPGYFGHIELSRPIFYIQYLTTIIKILRCTCVKCGKLLISKHTYQHVLDMPPEQRWNYVFALASKMKRCGEDTSDGCGCKQPTKIKKENLATLVAEWDNIEGIDKKENDEKLTMIMTPEIVLKQFSRISDADILFMGFSPVWSRPSWMICQVLAVPPPSVRPSVKHDSQQRSEDDLSHIIVNIIKTNKVLQDKINTDANAQVINDWHTLLQYHASTLVDNKIPGVAVAAQRSGRPLKSIKERLQSKGGRIRGNLMGKRVDFSARSVITPDPNLSIRQLGVPKKVAMNLTCPTQVNSRNIEFLGKLVQNGPEVYPGAKILERKNGTNISLRYVDRLSIKLIVGDIVHRHMLDGDPVLFNRQPTLHRMSMMCHLAKVMPIGDTFRMNVGCTKPYNADFDGDEMNMHMPQDVESASELMNLAAVPWQLISPANNKSIVGVFQDSLLGAYIFTQKNTKFDKRNAMNLLMLLKDVDVSCLSKKHVSSFEILTQIMPPLTLNYKTKSFKELDEYADSNAVIEIRNGKYLRGQIDKGVLGDGSKGFIQRICNDFGNSRSSDFIDNLQNIVTEFMKKNSYSVGISDLIADDITNKSIGDVITRKKVEVRSLIDQTHLGIFENNTGKSDEEEFESQINNILNRASNDAGKIGRESLSINNRFVTMVNAGSKGSELNISQMISCLGQQNVDGKRIPYGFEHRTLPHFNKFDDSPGARGFVESSFISGLSPEELFFHAMGGRVGLIDTAVKTSQTGYIQRRLIKGMEDLMVAYDMTVRNSKQKVIQFAYGDDGIDPLYVENQIIPLVEMTINDIYNHYNTSNVTGVKSQPYTKRATKRIVAQEENLKRRYKELINMMLKNRIDIIQRVFSSRENKCVHTPVAFKHLINNVEGHFNIHPNSLIDITPYEALEIIDKGFNTIKKINYVPPTELFKTLYYYYLTPSELLLKRRFNKQSLSMLIQTIIARYKKAIVAPGEMVGLIAAQSIGEPTTQMTLNTFHFAGVASKSNVTRGVPRIEEILSLSENPKNPSCTVHLFPGEETNKLETDKIIHRLEHTKLRAIVESIQICFDPDDMSTLIEKDISVLKQYKEFQTMLNDCVDSDVVESEKSKWVIRMEMNAEEMLDKNITMDDIHFAIQNSYQDRVSCVYSDYNDDQLVFRVRMIDNKKNTQKPLDQSDELYMLRNFQDELLDKMILRGVKNITRVIPRKITDYLSEDTDSSAYKKKEIWVLDTVGTNLLDLLSLDYIDVNRTYTNDIQEIYSVLGIESARQAIFNEISEVIEFDSTYINYHHLSLLCDRMTCNNKMVSIFRHGINNDNIGPIAKASFEETPEMFLKAARHAELDPMRGVSANVMCGQEGYFGTNSFQVLLDWDAYDEINTEISDEDNTIDEIFGQLHNSSDPCSISNISIQNNSQHIQPNNDAEDDTGYQIDF